MSGWRAFGGAASGTLAAALALLTGAGSAHAQPRTEGCLGGQIAHGHHCCWPGQRWSRRRRVCVGQPACPAGMQAQGATCVAAVCTGGRVIFADRAGHCCWPDQVWSGSRQACVGIPRCPDGLLARGDSCEAPTCADGQEIGPDTAGHCCWPDLVWSMIRQTCVGTPTCPSGLEVRGFDCVARASVPAVAAPAPVTPVVVAIAAPAPVAATPVLALAAPVEPVAWHRQSRSFFVTTDGYAGGAQLGLGFRFLTASLFGGETGGMAFGFDLGLSFAFSSAVGTDACVLGLPLAFTATWVQSLGSVKLLARGGLYTPLNYSFTSGSNNGWSLDLGFLGTAGLGVVLPSSGHAKWLLGTDLLFGGEGTAFLFTGGIAL